MNPDLVTTSAAFSAKQAIDSDRKIRAISLLKFSNISLTEIDSTIQPSNSDTQTCSTKYDSVTDQLNDELSFNYSPSSSDLNIIYYVVDILLGQFAGKPNVITAVKHYRIPTTYHLWTLMTSCRTQHGHSSTQWTVEDRKRQQSLFLHWLFTAGGPTKKFSQSQTWRVNFSQQKTTAFSSTKSWIEHHVIIHRLWTQQLHVYSRT